MPNQPSPFIAPTVHPLSRRHSLVRNTFPSVPTNPIHDTTLTMTKGKVAKPVKTVKAKIPKALREQVWRNWVGEKYDAKCLVTWCTNKITVFDFEVGHNIPESKGGTLDKDNLRPICSRCNKSMGNHYTIDQWNAMAPVSQTTSHALPTSPARQGNDMTVCCGCFSFL